ncbi:MAG: class I SAM-dependent methyltransferase [Burkholderiaceae bacterium]
MPPDSSVNRTSYNAIADEWRRARSKFYGREREYLDMLVGGLASGSRILDLGCGTGKPMAAYLIAQDFRVIGVDQAENLIGFAKTDFPGERWITSSIQHYDFGDEFSTALIWDALFHIERGQHARILKNVVARLPAQGKMMLTVGGSSHPPFTDFMFGQEFFYDSHTPQETEKLLCELGCRVLLAEFMNLPTEGRDKGRYAILAEKR